MPKHDRRAWLKLGTSPADTGGMQTDRAAQLALLASLPFHGAAAATIAVLVRRLAPGDEEATARLLALVRWQVRAQLTAAEQSAEYGRQPGPDEPPKPSADGDGQR